MGYLHVLLFLLLLQLIFVWLTPNATAWCEAVESFLDGQGYNCSQRYVFCLPSECASSPPNLQYHSVQHNLLCNLLLNSLLLSINRGIEGQFVTINDPLPYIFYAFHGDILECLSYTQDNL